MTFLLEPGFQFSAALDPHRASSWRHAIADALELLEDHADVALLGWQAATFIDAVIGRANRIVVIEETQDMLDLVARGLEANGWIDQVELLLSNPERVALDDRVDLVICPFAATWLMEGPAAAILANARSNIARDGGVVLPRRLVHLFELASAPTEVNGIAVRVPRYTRPGETIPVLSESKHFGTTDLTTTAGFPDAIEDTIIVKPLLSGTLTGVRLTTLLELGTNNVAYAAHSGFQSIFVPFREPLDVRAGEPVTIFVDYTMGGGLTESRFLARPIESAEPGWPHDEHEVANRFRDRIRELIETIDAQGRAADLDKVVSYTIDPHGDVSRLAALFWTVDEEFRKPLRDLVDGFRREAAQHVSTPSDDVIYEIMLNTYRQHRES
jgi:hypothetical protein